MLFTAVVSSALVAIASAQTIVTSSAASSIAATTTQSQVMPPSATAGFNPNGVNVTSTLKAQWCQGQRNQCPLICGGSASSNMCDPTTLTYSCTCSNGTVPDSTAFITTLPFFICQQTFIQCIANSGSDPTVQGQCTANEQCGTRNATAEYLAREGGAASGSSSSGASSSGSASRTSSGAASSTSGSSTATSSGQANMNGIATGAFAALLMAAARLVL